MGWWIVDEAAREVALHTADQVVVLRVRALTATQWMSTQYTASRRRENLRDDTEGVIFLNCAATDAAKKTLLHTTLEAHDGNLWGWLKQNYEDGESWVETRYVLARCRPQRGECRSMEAQS